MENHENYRIQIQPPEKMGARLIEAKIHFKRPRPGSKDTGEVALAAGDNHFLFSNGREILAFSKISGKVSRAVVVGDLLKRARINFSKDPELIDMIQMAEPTQTFAVTRGQADSVITRDGAQFLLAVDMPEVGPRFIAVSESLDYLWHYRPALNLQLQPDELPDSQEGVLRGLVRLDNGLFVAVGALENPIKSLKDFFHHRLYFFSS
jgi:hypothetical protein